MNATTIGRRARPAHAPAWWPAWLLALALLVTACGGGSGTAGSDTGNGGATTFAKSYGGPARDQATAALPRPGGGYVFAGTVNNRGSGRGRIGGLLGLGYEGDIWVSALDDIGDVQWQRSYGRASTLPANAPASDFHDGIEYLRLRAALDAENDGQRNGAWLVGRLKLREPNENPSQGGYTERGTDLLVTRLDANNQVVFSRTYDSGPFPGLPYYFNGEQTSEAVGKADIWPTADGGAIALADASATLRDGDRAVTLGAIHVVKVDAAGNPQASAVFRLDDGAQKRFLLHVRATPSGAVAVYDFGAGMQVTRFDVSSGSVAVRWRRNVEAGESPFDLLAADDDRDGALDGVVIAGRTNSPQLGGSGDRIHGFVMKLDADGNEQWRHRMGDEVGAVASTCVTAATPCHYVAAGAERSSVLVRALDAASGDLRAEGNPSDLQSAVGIRYLAAQDRFQLLVTESAGLTDQADHLHLFTLDRGLVGLGEVAIRGLSRIASIDAVVPDAGDDWLALSVERQRLFQINQLGNAGEIASLDESESTLERAFAVQALAGADGRSDAGFVVAGEASFREDIGDRGAWVLRLDAAGDIVWQKRLDGFRMLDWHAGFGEAADLLRTTPDGGFVIGGSSGRPDRHRVIKLSADGDIVWSTRALEPGGGALRALRVAADGSMLVAGGDSPRAWVARLGANGEVQWNHDYTAIRAGEPSELDANLAVTDLRVTTDGGSLLVGTATSLFFEGRRETSDAAAIRLDVQGAVLWAMSYPFGQAELLRNVRVAPSADGGFLIAASEQDRADAAAGGLFNLLLFKIDANGAVVWSQRYGGLYEEAVHGIEPLPDGGYLISAQSDSLGDYSEAWVLRVGRDGRIVEGCNADRGRGGVIARALSVTRGDYALPDSAEATAPADITTVNTSVVAREPVDVIVARQCFGNTSNTPGAATNTRTLTVRQAGSLTGVVSSTPPGIVCGTQGGGVCSAPFAEGNLVTLRVDIGSVRNFSTWGQGCESISGNFGEVCSVRVDADKAIDVIFSAAPPPPPPPSGQFTLTVMVDRLGGFVGTTDGSLGCAVTGGVPNTCAARYPTGRVVDLYAASLPGGNVVLESWQGDCATFGAQPNITLTMNRDYTCRAVFVSAP